MGRNKIGRNDLCPCGSGLKYKKCCLKSEQVDSKEIRMHHIQTGFKQRIRKNLSDEAIFLDPTTETIKMSEIILEFAEDMLRNSDTRSEKENAINIACLAWNLAWIKQKDNKEYENQLASFIKEMGIKDKDYINDMESLINALVNKKIEEYPMIDKLIVHYQVDFHKDELMLNVASTYSPEEVGLLTKAKGKRAKK
jgi:hypothetical protein